VFSGTFRGLGEGLARKGLDSAEGSLLGKLGFGHKADGSQNNPFWVKIAGQKAGADKGAGGPGGSASTLTSHLPNWMQKLFGIFGGSTGSPGAAGADVSVGADDSMWSGLMAGAEDGADVTGGVPIVVGEKGPEVMIPSESGTVVPNHKLGGLGGFNGDIHIDARGAHDPAHVTAQVHEAVMGMAPHIVSASVKAVQENRLRQPARGYKG
jgi:hypothetical protein